MKQAPLDAELIAKLRQLRGNKAPYTFATLLGVSRPTVVAALAGVCLQPGTRALLKIRIDELTAGMSPTVNEAAA